MDILFMNFASQLVFYELCEDLVKHIEITVRCLKQREDFQRGVSKEVRY